MQNYNVSITIDNKIWASPSRWHIYHILGYQDDLGQEILDRRATLNMEMENLVKWGYYNFLK
jgi:hypothetical protein